MTGEYVDRLIATLREWRERLLDEQIDILYADGGNVFHLDLLHIGASNRSLALIDGFIALHKEENFLCMAPIVRMHLDTAIRLHAPQLVDDPNQLADRMLRGENLDKIKDRCGEKLRDAYIRDQMVRAWKDQGTDLDWINKIYEKTSGHIHLSNIHTHATTSPVGTDNPGMSPEVRAQIGGKVASDYEGLAAAAFVSMIQISAIISTYMCNWRDAKIALEEARSQKKV